MRTVLCSLLVAAIAIHQGYAQQQASKDDQQRAAMYLNECIYTLTKIKSSENRIVLEEEQYKLNNILAWEGVSAFRTVVSYRKDLQISLNELIKNDIEKERYRRALEKKQNGAARDAIFGAISGVQVNVNLVSLVSNVVLSSARAFMDYNKKMDEYKTEFDDEMWKLKQDEMDVITDLRNSAFDVVDETFGKHGLKENMRLTEANVDEFLAIREISDPSLRVKQFSSKEEQFQYFPHYWYEKGFAYIDLFEKTQETNCLTQAWKMFDNYKSMMEKCKLYRYDDNLGMIALYELKYKTSLNSSQKEGLIKTVVTNVKENGNALLYCALQYLEMQKPNDAYQLLSRCMNDGKVTAKNEMVLAAAMSWEMLNDNEVKTYFIKSLVAANGINLDAYVGFLYMVRDDKAIDHYELYRNLQRTVKLEPKDYHKGDVCEVQIALENPEKFQLKLDDWTIVRDDYRVEIEKGQNQWYWKQRKATRKFAEPKKFFKSRQALAKETKYLEDHVELVTGWVSKVTLDSTDYYYLSSSKTWDKDVKEYFCDDKIMPGKIGSDKYKKEARKREKFYKDKFLKKYGVKEVDLYYQFEDKGEEKPIANYYGPICKIDIQVKSEDKCNVTLCFRTDYIEEDDTSFRFWGIRFGKEEVKF